MRCNGLPTTSTAAERARLHDAAVRFEALLFEAALEPFAKALGFFGEVATAAGAVALARAQRGGLAAGIERALE